MRPPFGISPLPLTHRAKFPSGDSFASADCSSVVEASCTRTRIPSHLPPTILKVSMGVSLRSICQPAEMSTSRQSSAYLYASSLFAMDMIENRPGSFFRHAAKPPFVESERRRGGCGSLVSSLAVWPQEGRTVSTSMKRIRPYFMAVPLLIKRLAQRNKSVSQAAPQDGRVLSANEAIMYRSWVNSCFRIGTSDAVRTSEFRLVHVSPDGP